MMLGVRTWHCEAHKIRPELTLNEVLTIKGTDRQALNMIGCRYLLCLNSSNSICLECCTRCLSSLIPHILARVVRDTVVAR